MSEKNYKQITADLSKNLSELRKIAPDAAAGFSTLAKAALKTNALDEKTKEFIALAVGITSKCDGCIGFHAKALVNLGATREEIAEVLAMCMYMGGGPAYMYAADALAAFDQFSKKD